MPRRSPISCPLCQSPRVRPARTKGFREILLKLLGYDCARCLQCGHRFMATPIGSLGNVTYAKCPRCLRLDLAVWDPKYYRASFWTELKVWFGGHRWRCEPCRTNFVSFRPRKEKYSGAGAGEDQNLLPI